MFCRAEYQALNLHLPPNAESLSSSGSRLDLTPDCEDGNQGPEYCAEPAAVALNLSERYSLCAWSWQSQIWDTETARTLDSDVCS